MTPSQVEAALRHLTGLYPRWPVTPQIVAAMGARLTRLDLSPAQVTAFMDEHRMTSRSRAPNVAAIMGGLAGLVQREQTQRGVFIAPMPTTVPVTGFERELVLRHRANPEDPIFAVLERKHKANGTVAIFRERFREAAAFVDRTGWGSVGNGGVA